MQTVQRRTAAVPHANGNGQNGHASSVPLTKQQQRRRKKRKKKPFVEDWAAVVLLFVLLLIFGYWIVTKFVMGGVGGSEDDDHAEGGDRKKHRHREKPSPMQKLKEVPFNKIYSVPDAHPKVGDRSNRYAKMRKHYDEILPKDFERSTAFVEALRSGQAAGDYNVVPILAHESHGSLHQHHKGHRHRHAEEETEEERREEEKEEQDEEKSEEELMKEQVYDIYDCPYEPVEGYPYAWPIMQVLDNWSPDDTSIPDVIYQGLCVFDFQKDFKKAMHYRTLELPFVAQNDPEVARTVERWNYPGFMQDLLTDVNHRAEYSENNHFMYHLPPKAPKHGKKAWMNRTPKDYKPPTENIRMQYQDWLKHANVTGPALKRSEQADDREGDDKEGDDDGEVAGPHKEHWYFRLIGCGLTGPDGSCDKGSSEYLYDELPYFQPVDNLYLAKGDQQKGIHCRFGMKGVIAENHFDGSRNAIVLLGGARRYILSHPDQCEPLSLYPNGHPSARHSQVDYTNPDLHAFPQFAQSNSNEVILQPGDVLYLPTHWFHYIVSLELNFQCNSRSGIGYEYEDVINDCGF